MLLQIKSDSCSLLQGCIIVYIGNNGSGTSKTICFSTSDLTGYYLGSSTTTTWNDQINSIRVGPKTKAKLYKHVDYSGTTWALTNNNESNSNCVILNLNADQVSSIKIKPIHDTS